jgi:hypothetical protein
VAISSLLMTQLRGASVRTLLNQQRQCDPLTMSHYFKVNSSVHTLLLSVNRFYEGARCCGKW